jgi:hypothetical protein
LACSLAPVCAAPSRSRRSEWFWVLAGPAETADRKTGIGQYFCSLATVGEAGPLGPSVTVGCWRAGDSGRNRLRCVPAPAATPMASNVRMDPTMSCLLSPVAYVHQLIGLEESAPAPGRMSVHSVSPRSGAIFLGYSLICGGWRGLLARIHGYPLGQCPDDGNWPCTAVHLVAPPRSARGLCSGDVAVTDVTASRFREQLSPLDQGVGR